jgi:hypothetical protein
MGCFTPYLCQRVGAIYKLPGSIWNYMKLNQIYIYILYIFRGVEGTGESTEIFQIGGAVAPPDFF